MFIMRKLDRVFYDRDSIIVAKELLGKVLVHKAGGEMTSAIIVETEAYMGIEDKAAHSYGGRRTPRVEVMYGPPGFSYVFTIYGLHCCFNVVTKEKGNPQAVLIRAVEPTEGVEHMARRRFSGSYGELTKIQRKSLSNGPGKLCAAMSINKECNGLDLCGNSLYIENRNIGDFEIIEKKRVGIDYAEEAKDFLWRFYIKDNEHVSVK